MKPIVFTDTERRRRARNFVTVTAGVDMESFRSTLSETALDAVAAAQTLARQSDHAKRAGSVKSEAKTRGARKGGRPRDVEPSPAALYQREWRARKKITSQK